MSKSQKQNSLSEDFQSKESLFITSPDSFDDGVSRTNTSFGLRPLEHAHDEEVVPQIGSLEFVRQASWAVAAIKLFNSDENVRKVAKTPTTLANAIEALGCKLEYTYASDIFQNRRGILAFKRPASVHLWRFSDLKKKSNYVQNTYRQNVVSALRDLGLCNKDSTRFNQMQLTELGEELADCFLKDAKKILSYWVSHGSAQKNATNMDILSPDFCSKDERNVLKNALNTDVMDDENIDPGKRIRLIRLMGSIKVNDKNPWKELSKMLKKEGELGLRHVWQIENAIRFEKVKTCARALYNECANYMVKNNSNSCSFGVLSKIKSVLGAYNNLRDAIETYRRGAQYKLPAISEKNMLISSGYMDVNDTLRYLAEHEGRALIYNGNGVTKGPLLKKDGFAPVSDRIQSWGHPKLMQLDRLWRDCNGK